MACLVWLRVRVSSRLESLAASAACWVKSGDRGVLQL